MCSLLPPARVNAGLCSKIFIIKHSISLLHWWHARDHTPVTSQLEINSVGTLHYSTLHYITLHYITLHYITVHYIALHCITLHFISVHYITLHYISQHYITVHYTTLHLVIG